MLLFRSAAVLAGALLLASPLWGADGAPRASPTSREGSEYSHPTQTVVVLDVAKVFKNHVRFKQRMDAIRSELDVHNKEMSKEHQDIVARGSRSKDFKSGSIERKKIEDQTTRQVAELRIRDFTLKNDLFDREGKIYFDTYQEIVAAVDHLATQYNISLVLRYSSEETDPLERGSILKAINREVVYQKHLDITNLVISHVNGTTVAAKIDSGTKR